MQARRRLRNRLQAAIRADHEPTVHNTHVARKLANLSTGGHTRRPAAVQRDETRARGAPVVSAIQRQNELLDHILASEGLMPRLGQLRQVPVVTIYNEDTPTLVETNPTINGIIPDHAPVTAVFI